MDERARVLEATEALLRDFGDADRRTFLGAQFDAGLAFVHFPEGHGGLGASPALQREIQARIAEAGGPSPSHDIGYGMGAPTIVTHGTDEQRRRWLRPLFTGEEVWCQLFSEPGSGSDVASLATRAVRDGDEWIVNGQKVWTSLAHLARWGLLVARTDPSVPKHKGLTYFVVDMHQPGVEVRPLRQMTGHAEFNEVYFTDARVPDAFRLDAVGEGWRVALTTLMNERVSIGGGTPPRGSGIIAGAVDAWRRNGHTDPARKDQLLRLWVEAEVLRLTNLRAAAARKVGVPGPEGSVGKLAAAELNKKVSAFTISLMGMEGTLHPSGYDLDRFHAHLLTEGDARQLFLRSRANSIEGGSSEVMRNILAERVLGLPGDVRVDKDVAWIDVPRS
ncbi:MAG: acyl-CoA dehydrogenase family protein [Acidimicrobiales bacterium]|jgi:alkylation response protein AidB-like acyl-CoA dehydrogenase|nr:acyl-CoA dehydrogenase family protein [Acidimicrobiales bacterium]